MTPNMKHPQKNRSGSAAAPTPTADSRHRGGAFIPLEVEEEKCLQPRKLVLRRNARRLFAALTFSTQSPRRECLSYHRTPPEGARTPSPNENPNFRRKLSRTLFEISTVYVFIMLFVLIFPVCRTCVYNIYASEPVRSHKAQSGPYMGGGG